MDKIYYFDHNKFFQKNAPKIIDDFEKSIEIAKKNYF